MRKRGLKMAAQEERADSNRDSMFSMEREQSKARDERPEEAS